MKPKPVTISVILIAVILAYSCKTKTSIDNVVKIKVYPDSVVNSMQGGFGASMHAIEDSLPVSTDNGSYRSWGGSVWGGNPNADDTIRWNAIYRHADWLGLDWCRVEIDHGMYEPEKNKFTFNNPEMNIMYRWLEYCQSRNVDVYFTEMWPDVKWLTHPNFLNDGVTALRSAPNDFDAWAIGYVHLLDYLINVRKYSCIKWISLTNEPMEDWGWWKAVDGTPQDILPGLKAMKKYIDLKALPVQLVATDGPFKYSTDGFEKYLPYIGALSFHDYSSTFDWMRTLPYISHTADMVIKWKDLAKNNGNIPIFMAEFGTFLYGFGKDTIGPSSYMAVLHDVQLALRLSNAGVDGMNRWSFTNRGDLDGQWQLIDTWDRAKRKLTDSIFPHPNSYFMYGMLTRFTAKNSDILFTSVSGITDTSKIVKMDHSIDNIQHVFACTYRSPRNKNISLFVTNDAEKNQNVSLDLSNLKGSRFYLYQISEKNSDRINLNISPVKEFAPEEVNIQLPARSIVVITTYNLNEKALGIRLD